MKLVEHKLQNESNKKEDFSTNTSSYEANEICTISSKTYVSDCSSVNSNNSLYINIDKNQFDNDNSVNLKNQLFTTSNQNTSSLDTFSNTISCKNYNSEESLSDGKLFKAENNDSADLVVDNESSFSNLSLEESEKLDLHDHLERETNTFYRKKINDYLADDLIKIPSANKSVQENKINDESKCNRLERGHFTDQTNQNSKERGNSAFCEVKSDFNCYKTPLDMRNEANYNNSAFNRNNQDVKDKINLKSTVTLECGKKNNIYSDNLNNNRENNYSNNVKYSENINSPKFGQNQQTISLIKNSSANPNIEINKIYFEKYKDKIRRSHRGFSIIDENTVNNGLKKAIQNVSTDGEYRNYIEAEAKAYSTYIKSVLPSDINLNTSIPIFPQLENGLILAYFLNSIKKNTIDLSKIVILKKDDMNYLWETTNNLNYIIRACKNLGLKTINIGSNDIQNRKQTLVLGLLWQMIKFDLTKDNNLFSRPELVDLKKEGECVSEFGRISSEELCLRWINYHLKLAKKKDFFAKFEENSPVDILDSLEDDKISTKSKIKLIKSSKNDEYKKDLYKKFIAASSSVSKFNKSIGKTKTFITNSEVDNLDEVDVNSNEDEIKAPKYYQSYIRKTETPQNNSHADLSTQTNFYNSESFVKNVEFNEKLPRDNIYNVPIRCRNLNNDLKDSKIYLILLKHLADSEISDEEIMSAWLETNLEKRAERVIFLANKIDCKSFISPHDIIHGDLKLNFLFVQNLMNKRSGLPNTKANIKMLHKKLQSAEDNLKLCQSKIQNLSSEIEQTSSEKISCIEENKNLKKNMTNLAIQYEKHIRDLENNVKLFVYQIENQIQDEVKINLFNDKVKLGNLFNKEKESDLQQQRLKSIQNGYIDNLKFESNSINESKEQISSIVSRLNTEIKLLVTEKNQALKIIEDKNVMDKQMDDQINQYLEYMKKNHKKKSKNVFRFLGCNK